MHYKAVAQAAKGFPIMFYNLPACARNALSAGFIVDLAQKVENLRGVKDSSGHFVHMGELLAHAPKGFVVINGVDNYSYQALVTGAQGCVASAANVVPELFLAIIKNVKKGGTIEDTVGRQCICNGLVAAVGLGFGFHRRTGMPSRAISALAWPTVNSP